jgi:uncharacterized protein (DUF2062 family)
MKIDLARFFRAAYLKIIRINDSPHKIAGGFALGVFLGILPGAGPMASVVLAYFFQVNKAAALAGSLLTNSWFSVVTFALAIKTGAWLTGSKWQELYEQAKALVTPFDWRKFFDGSSLPIIKPLLAGYAAIGLVSGAVIYAVVWLIVIAYRKRKKRIKAG